MINTTNDQKYSYLCEREWVIVELFPDGTQFNLTRLYVVQCKPLQSDTINHVYLVHNTRGIKIKA